MTHDSYIVYTNTVSARFSEVQKNELEKRFIVEEIEVDSANCMSVSSFFTEVEQKLGREKDKV